MARKDVLLAMLVVVAWGLNFAVIKVVLHAMPPLILAGLRFLLVACRPTKSADAPAARLWPDHQLRAIRSRISRRRVRAPALRAEVSSSSGLPIWDRIADQLS